MRLKRAILTREKHAKGFKAEMTYTENNASKTVRNSKRTSGKRHRSHLYVYIQRWNAKDELLKSNILSQQKRRALMPDKLRLKISLNRQCVGALAKSRSANDGDS